MKTSEYSRRQILNFNSLCLSTRNLLFIVNVIDFQKMSEKGTNQDDLQMEVEDEFQPDFVVPDIDDHHDGSEAETTKVLIIQSDDIIAKDDEHERMKEENKSPEKVIHIQTR